MKFFIKNTFFDMNLFIKNTFFEVADEESDADQLRRAHTVPALVLHQPVEATITAAAVSAWAPETEADMEFATSRTEQRNMAQIEPAAGSVTSQAAPEDAREVRRFRFNNEESRTTVMLRNLPLDHTRDMLLHLLDTKGFAGMYDFIYLPMDFKTRAGR